MQLFNIPRVGGHWVKGVRGQSILLPDKVACDMVGTVIGTGIAFVADAKSCEEKYRFPFSKVADHQIDELIRAGQAGAISGLIVESIHLRLFFWVPWEVLNDLDVRSVRFDDPRLTTLGSANTIPDLKSIVHPLRKLREAV